ncbi:MAG: hypothetical protein WCO92_05750 [Verrucomicrobiota bacterium]
MFRCGAPEGGGERNQPGEGRDPGNNGRDPRFDHDNDEGDDNPDEQRGDPQHLGAQEEAPRAIQINPIIQEGDELENRAGINELQAQAARTLATQQDMQQKTWLDHFMEAFGNPLKTLLRLKDAVVEKVPLN